MHCISQASLPIISQFIPPTSGLWSCWPELLAVRVLRPETQSLSFLTASLLHSCLSMSPATNCPPETWDAIIRCLPRYERQNCLSICRSIHDVALRLLFHHVILEFGIWELLKPQYNDLEAPEERVLATVKRRTAELLVHIALNPRFAQVIRHLTIHSFIMRDELEEESKSVMIASTSGPTVT